MKIQNPIKLIIKFIGGGVINFPTKHLRYVDVEPINSSDNNILILNGEEYNNISKRAYINIEPIYTREKINYESEEDLTISIYELNETSINNIINYINEAGYTGIPIGPNGDNILIVDKFEDLNHHYEENGDKFQDIKIHIHKTAVILPILKDKQ